MSSERVRRLLVQIYGVETGESALLRLNSILEKYRAAIPAPRQRGLSERDAILITYPDQVQEPGRPPLESLADFCEEWLDGLLSGIHVLPFYPWSSDDGFSVIDYRQVATQYGRWADIRGLGEGFRLMFDAVINHASAESAWFQGYLEDQPGFRDYFIEVHGTPDISSVVRPRALPLLTVFHSATGPRQVWTTFSADQADLNYHNPEVLLQVLDLLLFYARQGAQFIRLDAIAYLWKELGTSCIHLRQTHWIVQLIRAVLDDAAPHVMLITETNVPNLENLSYFGDGSNEAQLVYNFPLPPLVLHAMHTGDAGMLSRWAATLELPSESVTFLNFLASHDGIGLNPLRGILPESEIRELAGRIERAGGFISTRTNATGSESPYELNINYLDALNAADGGSSSTHEARRFLAAHAILLAFEGVPALYFHSLFGSHGWPEGVHKTGRYRSINREKLQRAGLVRELGDPGSPRSEIFRGLQRLLKARAAEACFSPETRQRMLETPGSIFALVREGARHGVLCVHSVSRDRQHVTLDLSATALSSSTTLRDLLSSREFPSGSSLLLSLEPFETLWLRG